MTDHNQLVTLVTTKPEAATATDLLKRLDEALKPIAVLMDEAASHGLQVAWECNTGPDMKHRFLNLRLIKTFCQR